jgi:hypothetical protein
MCNALRILVHSVLQAIVLNKEMLNDGEKQFERIGIIYPTVEQTNTFSQVK